MLFAMDKAAAACIAESTGWLSRQPAEFRAEVIRRSHLRRFEAGEILPTLAIRQAACTGWSRRADRPRYLPGRSLPSSGQGSGSAKPPL